MYSSFTEIGYWNVNWINLLQERVQIKNFTVMARKHSATTGHFLSSSAITAPHLTQST
jgi:hypothetical protein